MTEQKPRQFAFHILRQRAAGGDFVEHLLEVKLAHATLAPKDRGLCQELVYGVARWQATLDRLIARKTAGRVQKEALQILLRLGLYQLFWLDRIPEHAAVHETVELAKQNGFGSQAGFVNAVLRGYLREPEAARQFLEALKASEPAAGYSHPEWLWLRWRDRWGADKAADLMRWNNTPPKTYARINTLKVEAGKLLSAWREQEGVDYDFFQRDWTGENLVFELKSHPPLAKLPSFQQGWFYVQDPSTLLAARMLDPQPGETVLDLCAAPGGKTTYLAQLMRNQGTILACDNSSDRLKLLQENCTRLGAACVEPALVSALGARRETRFDKVILDAPCSNTGVMRRRVDLRWRIRPEEITRLRGVQLDLLRLAAARARLGGTLVYSTCSLEEEENAGVVAEFLKDHAGFRLKESRELLPFENGVDGAFVASLELVA